MKPNNASMGGFRWTICALLFLATMINYIDRQIIGILKPDLSKQLGWSEDGYGTIVAAFQLAYAFGYLLGGRFMDRVGVKRGLPLVAILWSAACAAHGLVRTVLGFSFARLGLGLTEGGNFPASIKAIGEWFPVRERAIATGIFNSATNVGAIVCPLTVPWLAVRFGWQSAFYVTGAMGVVWVALWAWLYDPPETHPRLSAAEREYIDEGRTQSLDSPAVPWLQLLRCRETWAYTIASALTGPVWWFYLFWFPDFVNKQYHLDKGAANLRVAAVYAVSILGSVGGGWLSLVLLRKGWSRLAARKTSLLVCAIAVVPVFLAPQSADSWVAVGLVGLAAAAHQGWSANLYSFASDVMPRPAVSSLVGLGGFASGLAAMLVAKIVGHVLQVKAGYAPLFAWASSMYIVSILILHLLAGNTDRPALSVPVE